MSKGMEPSTFISGNSCNIRSLLRELKSLDDAAPDIGLRVVMNDMELVLDKMDILKDLLSYRERKGTPTLYIRDKNVAIRNIGLADKAIMHDFDLFRDAELAKLSRKDLPADL